MHGDAVGDEKAQMSCVPPVHTSEVWHERRASFQFQETDLPAAFPMHDALHIFEVPEDVASC